MSSAGERPGDSGGPDSLGTSAAPASLIARLAERGLTIAVAESLTGGLLTASLIEPGGASQVVLGGIVAYSTELKATLLHVDEELLRREGPVHPRVASLMALGARRALAVAGRAADVGLATTGVAGPDPQGGREPGTVFLALSAGDEEPMVRELALSGDRSRIRTESVNEALRMLDGWLAARE